jgi:PiT family inorganic phosphate transporter
LNADKQKDLEAVKKAAPKLSAQLATANTVGDLPLDSRVALRADISGFAKHANAVIKAPPTHPVWATIFGAEKEPHIKAISQSTDYAPLWVKLMIAIALGLGTTIGWKRIVVTIGEKIGKSHLTYAQGASAEVVAMTTIGLAAASGLPVSTTHVLSSGVAGTMVANSSGVQSSTITKIALAWVLTMPVSMVLSGTLYIIFRTLFH